MINQSEFTCPVCCESNIPFNNSYSIGTCSHRFCLDCCISHIQARLNTFEEINCLQTGCKTKLTTESLIYSKLTDKIIQKIGKYDQFIKIQKNSNYKPCNKENCFGVIDITKLQQNKSILVCTFCKTNHCSKCYMLSHSQKQVCKILNEQQRRKQEEQMKALNYRRCPSCSVWVQKAGGCQYLNCKCKTTFCFNCGSKFEHDPCRKAQIREQQRQLKKLTNVFSNVKKPESWQQYCLLIPKIILKFILFIIFTILSSLVFFLLVFGILIPIVILVAPGFLIFVIGQANTDDKTKTCIRILIIIFYPLIGTLFGLIVFFVFITYPLLRSILQMQIYDELDRFICMISIIYLKAISCILSI